MNARFRDELLAAAAQATFPSEKTWDASAGKARLETEAQASLQHLFDLFGVTDLDPDDEDFDKVINTACGLALEVAGHVARLGDVGGAIDALPESADWHPDYRAYVSALWQGERDVAAACAKKLNLTHGIPNGSPSLEHGPLV